MNCGMTQIRLWSKSNDVITKTIADANALMYAYPSEFFRENGPEHDWYGFCEPLKREGKTWQNDRVVYVARTNLCERLDLLQLLETSIRSAAKANGVLLGETSADPDFVHDIEALFETWIEADSFTFADRNSASELSLWLMGLDSEV